MFVFTAHVYTAYVILSNKSPDLRNKELNWVLVQNKSLQFTLGPDRMSYYYYFFFLQLTRIFFLQFFLEFGIFSTIIYMTSSEEFNLGKVWFIFYGLYLLKLL